MITISTHTLVVITLIAVQLVGIVVWDLHRRSTIMLQAMRELLAREEHRS